MNVYQLNGNEFASMVEFGAKWLINDIDRINALNVFPVPDGDTGTNMRMTIEGGVEEGKKADCENVGTVAKNMARAMTLNARGNSGVILSQFFKGISTALKDKEILTTENLKDALLEATNRCYKVVQNPTEGTILTVMREAGINASNEYNDKLSLLEYLEMYLKYANESLENTPNLLPVLKKAGVIDSGGAGLVLIIEGMIKYLKGEKIEDVILEDEEGFNANSKLVYGYLLNYKLQLLNSKVNISDFRLEDLNKYLNGIGTNSKTSLDGSIVNVSIITFNPGQVIIEMRKYGEITELKFANLDCDDEANEELLHEAKKPEFKKYATVAVANGSGLVNAFKEMGIDEVVSGGQTMNTSTQDFIKAFDSINAEYILVFPNNGNILMAANQARDNYDKAKVIVLPTKTLAQGYSAASMINFESDDIDQIVEELNQTIQNVSTLEVTYSVRDCLINNIKINKGDFICIYNGDLISSDKDRMSAVKKAFRNIPDFNSKSIMIAICGIDVKIEETEEIKSIASALNNYLEVYALEGNQDIYSYIIGLE